MAILLATDYGAEPAAWRRALARRAGPVDLRLWPEAGDPRDIEVILVDSPRPLANAFGRFPRLRLVSFLGHGAGDVLRDPSLPAAVPVTRLKDPLIAQGLREYIVHAVSAHHLEAGAYADQQRQARWHRRGVVPSSERQVAVLGLGSIGQPAAESLRDLGFRVSGWSSSPKSIDGVECLHGDAALEPLLARSDYVVAVLPATERTEGLFDRAMFDVMKPGAYLVNVGRGSLIVEADLLAALDSGRLGGACLDVFRTEPLPADDPLWRHPKVIVTPHTGGCENGPDHMDQVAENCRRLMAGEALLNLADRRRGY
jgi:glyoxylate/hydroxypyruvate reductase A